METRVRMYRQGLGDCFLLTFGAGQEARHVLIDCGTLGSKSTAVKMKAVAEDIAATTGRHLHLLIATHEHKDHVSGFRDQKKVFDPFEVDHVWLAWSEDADDELAQELEKHRGDLIRAARLAAHALEGNRSVEKKERQELKEVGHGIRQLLSFCDEGDFDDAVLASKKFAETVQEAMAWVTGKGASRTFLRPEGKAIEPEWLPGVRFYVLGPPRYRAALAQLGHHGSPDLYHLAAMRARDLVAGAAFFAADQPMGEYWESLDPREREQVERLLPFDLRFRLDASDEEVLRRFPAYYRPGEEWRRVDYDWLSGAADLALQLDGQTNNTSLVLAIELIEDGRVLLFPGDAQVGNWLSWHRDAVKWKVPDGAGGERVVTAADLLARTVLYKVGHHASHNATVTEKGLELMTAPELVAFIPVDREVALNKHPTWPMPARALYKRLLQKARGRVVRSDIGWASRRDVDFATLFKPGEWDEWERNQRQAPVQVEDLFVEWSTAPGGGSAGRGAAGDPAGAR